MNAYANGSGKKESAKELSSAQISQQGDTSKVDMLKASIADGSYRVDLRQLAEKIATDLM
jgi:anti-sigma28 factor (negative regulator of flagellin synthesis)